MATEKIIVLASLAVGLAIFLIFGFGDDLQPTEDGEAEVLDSKKKEE